MTLSAFIADRVCCASDNPHVGANHAGEFIRCYSPPCRRGESCRRIYSQLFVVIFFRYNSTVLFIYSFSNIIFYIYALFLVYVYIYKKYSFIMQYNAFFYKNIINNLFIIRVVLYRNILIVYVLQNIYALPKRKIDDTFTTAHDDCVGLSRDRCPD